MMTKFIASLAVLAVIASATAANAGEFKVIRLAKSKTLNTKRPGYVISFTGEIELGDPAELRRHIERIRTGPEPLLLLAVDSPGGVALASFDMGDIIAKYSVPVGVMKGRRCVSACFHLFAASPRRYASLRSAIGVHSGSIEGQENASAMAATIITARILTHMWNVPAQIVGKLVATPTDSVTWLDRSDMIAMNATILD